MGLFGSKKTAKPRRLSKKQVRAGIAQAGEVAPRVPGVTGFALGEATDRDTVVVTLTTGSGVNERKVTVEISLAAGSGAMLMEMKNAVA